MASTAHGRGNRHTHGVGILHRPRDARRGGLAQVARQDGAPLNLPDLFHVDVTISGRYPGDRKQLCRRRHHDRVNSVFEPFKARYLSRMMHPENDGGLI